MALSTNLIAYWKLDGNSNDAVGSNNGSDTSITYSSGNGKIVSGAGYASGSASVITLANSGTLFPSAQISIALWVKLTSTSQPSVIRLFHQENASPSATTIWYSSGQFNAGLNGAIQINGSGFTPDTNWHFVVLTYDGSHINLYVDGTPATSPVSYSSSLNSNSGVLTIGNNTGFTNGLYGCLDEIGLWSRALTSTEVTSLYNGGAGNQYPFGTAWSKTLTESPSFTDTVLKGATKLLTQSVTYTASIIRSVAHTLTETASITASVFKTAARTLADSFTSSDAFEGLRTKASALTETVTHTAAIIRNVVRVLTDSVTYSDAFTGFKATVAEFTDSVTATATLITNPGKLLADVVTYSDLLIASKAFLRTFTETATATASLVNATGRSLAESFTSTDTFERVWTVVRTFTETVTYSAFFRFLKNGSTTIWRNVQKNTATLSTVAKHISTWRNKDKS